MEYWLVQAMNETGNKVRGGDLNPLALLTAEATINVNGIDSKRKE